MGFQRPTLDQLIERTEGDIEARLPEANARLRRSLLGVLARVLAGAVHGLYGYLDWLAKQLFPDTAEREHLERWAGVWGVARRPAAAATGEVRFTGEDGRVIPAGTQLQRDDGMEYATDAEAVIAGGESVVAVTAGSAGADGNAEAGATLQLVSAIDGVEGEATVAGDGLAGGADLESDSALRARLLQRIQAPPHGGSAADYVSWALEVPGVAAAWTREAWMGLGTVGVLFTVDDEGDPIPTPEDIDRVTDHIAARRPVTAEVHVIAPTSVPLDPEIEVTPNTEAVRAAIRAEIEDLLERVRAPGVTVKVSQIHRAIALAEGIEDYTLIAPAADVTHEPQEVPVMGEIAWQT